MARHDATDELIAQGFAALGQRGTSAPYSSGATAVVPPRPSFPRGADPRREITQLRGALKQALDERARLIVEIATMKEKVATAVEAARKAWAARSGPPVPVEESAVEVTPIEGVYEDDDDSFA